MPLVRILRNSIRGESGTTLIESVVALAVLGTIAVTFLSGIAISSKATFLTDTRATALSLAQSQMEYAQNATYNGTYTWYPTAPIPSGTDYIDYSADITATSIPDTDANIKKITVTVRRAGTGVFTLEGYKVDR